MTAKKKSGRSVQRKLEGRKGSLTPEEKSMLQGDVDKEGFDYVFESYSTYREIKDARFHALRKAYLAAKSKLAHYIGVR